MEGSCLEGFTCILEFGAYEDVGPGAYSGLEILAGRRLTGVPHTIRERLMVYSVKGKEECFFVLLVEGLGKCRRLHRREHKA